MSRAFDDETGGHGGDLKKALKLWNPADGNLVDFSSNINPLGPPPGLLDHLRESLPDMTAYPSPQARELRAGLASFFQVVEKRLLLGNGANELIHLLHLCNRPKRVFVPAPSFSEYERAARLCGAEVVRYSLPPGEDVELPSLAENLTRGDLLIFCNPNNPTGKLYLRRELCRLADAVSGQGADLMIDESFIPLTGSDRESLRNLDKENLWVIISLTKLWGLPGLRLGCMIGPENNINHITRWGDPWRVNFLAQRAGLFCLKSRGYIESSLDLISKERKFLIDKFTEMEVFHVFDGSANYLLIRSLLPGFTVERYQEYLARRGVLVRRADNFPGLDERYFRIAVRRREENLRLVAETVAFLKEQ